MTNYSIKTDIRFSPMEKFDIQDVVDANTDTWFNQTLVRINDSVLRLGVLEGEFHFHKHDNEDELFYVVEGNLLLDVEDQTHELGPGQGFVVPKGVVHRTRAPSRVVVLMTASADVVPVGD
ncbi:MAG: cupin domain-containing protein [Alphaproteobacteria bacterium]|nr:cupin domain-containing protein [Alphaproteobacteria bacterium]